MWRKKEIFNPDFNINHPDYEGKLYEIIDDRIRSYLQSLKKSDPQIEMNGFHNIWIAKPNCNKVIYFSYVKRKRN